MNPLVKYEYKSVAGTVDLDLVTSKDDLLDEILKDSGIREEHDDAVKEFEFDPIDDDDLREKAEGLITGYEDVPDKFDTPESVDEELFEWLALSEDEKEMVFLYWNKNDSSANIDEITDAYYSRYDSTAKFAEHYCTETGLISPGSQLCNHVDFDSYWESDLTHDWIEIKTDKGDYLFFRNI